VSTPRDLLGELVRTIGRRHEPPAEDYERVLLAARNAWQKKVRERKRRRVLLAIAASFAMVAISGALLVRVTMSEPVLLASTLLLHGDVHMQPAGESGWHRMQPNLRIATGAHLRSGRDSGAAFELRDGTSIRLGANSQITFDSAHAVKLDAGMLYVDTGAARSADAIRVETPLGAVRDVGTIFEVKASSDAVRMRIREGRVRLERAGAAAAIEGGHDEEVEVDREGNVMRREFSRNGKEWQWAESLAVAPDIEGRPLLQLLAWVARETGRQLKFADPAAEAQARAVTLHGTAANLAPLEALDVLLSTTDLEYVLPSNLTIVIRKRQDN
jgi:ferric-dicitrate binding protein FerR (iron transport regulator)